MAKNLGINKGMFTNMLKNGTQSMRMNYYPPCPEASKVLGISPHSDATGLTILLQFNQVEGLQIKHNGTCVPVKILPSALLVNIESVRDLEVRLIAASGGIGNVLRFSIRYQASNTGKFHSTNAAKKQVGGCFYVVKRILPELQSQPQQQNQINAASRSQSTSTLRQYGLRD
ncbi:hypothetical protein Sjap_020583 [Stephania japonica]|uniref:Fe2OG dioxygenase domain-containing protein n=1 Tax=Stephania japonica TaxID=461633 RepID=A0AAP0F9X0_9MAGN